MPRVRRSVAAAALVLAAGGLVLARTPANANAPQIGATTVTVAAGSNTASFSGPGAQGTFALSHTLVLAGGEQRFFAELNLKADPAQDSDKERAPLAMVVVLDTSGSMGGEKIEQAKNSVIQLVRDLRDDDEIAFIRYSSDSELIQPLARAGEVRESLLERVQSISAGGGTNIAPALQHGVRALSDAGKGRVRRVVLVSDGLDSTRPQSEETARESASRGITVSSLGIGLDFDEGYMGAVAQSGHGNFGFVKDASSLATFLRRELKETASTTVESATARLKLPAGVRFVRALGADARTMNDGTEVELSMGSLFAGDERRVVLELATTVAPGDARDFQGEVSWSPIGKSELVQARFADLKVVGSTDEQAVTAGRDGGVYARAMSALASLRQMEAADAYRRGDMERAQALIDGNMADLKAAAAAAPAPAATALESQIAAYDATKKKFNAVAPQSAEGRAAAKAVHEKDLSNVARQTF